jgi:hypothetical protein
MGIYKLIDLGPGHAMSINNSNAVVGSVGSEAMEWSGGKTIDLGPGAAYGINDAGAVVGQSGGHAVEFGTCVGGSWR